MTQTPAAGSAVATAMSAYLVDKSESGFVRGVQQVATPVPKDDEVLVRVEWSSVNYKDALAATEHGKVVRDYPRIPGIDLAGTIAAPGGRWQVGTAVLAHGRDLGVSRDGGFAQFCCVPAGWLLEVPIDLGARRAMVAGTAGFTAAESVLAHLNAGTKPDAGPILVTGATGGVGSFAVALLAAHGYQVVASTSRQERADWLRQLGAAEVIDRLEAPAKPLERERWAGVVDTVGGQTLAAALTTARYGSVVTACGNTGGMSLETTVFPFILRGVSLVGIDSVNCSDAFREHVWRWLSAQLPTAAWDLLAGATVDLEGLTVALDEVLAGQAIGRTLVEVA